MRDFDRRIRRIAEELNTGEPDGSTWWEDYKKGNPISAQILDEFFEKHKDDPDFQKENTGGRVSDKVINQFADYYFERLPELVKDPKFASMFKKGIGCGSTALTTSGFDGRQEDQPN